MTRVFLLGHGFDGVDDAAREMIDACVRETLAAEQVEASFGDGYWTMVLPEPPGFDFLPLEQTLGMNLGDALPSSLKARPWRRLINEIQVALYHHEVRQYCLDRGMPEINSVWFWGGGECPQHVPHGTFDTAVSDHPVSQGLAVLGGVAVRESDGLDIEQDQSLFWDWALSSNDAEAEMKRLEQQLEQWITDIRRGRLELRVLDGNGRQWQAGQRQMRRFWRRPRTVAEMLRDQQENDS